MRCGATAGVKDFLQRRELVAAFEGLEAGALYGELFGYPLYGVRATLLSVRRPKGTSPDALRKACSEALPLAIANANPVLLEPLMKLELRCPERHVGAVLKELTGKRRADVQQLVAPGASSSSSSNVSDSRHLIQAEVPLSNLIGYADAVRSLTHGEAALSMEFARYKPLDGFEYEEMQRKSLGF